MPLGDYQQLRVTLLYSRCLSSPSTHLPGKDQRGPQSPTHSHRQEMSSDGPSRSQRRYAVKSPPHGIRSEDFYQYSVAPWQAPFWQPLAPHCGWAKRCRGTQRHDSLACREPNSQMFSVISPQWRPIKENSGALTTDLSEDRGSICPWVTYNKLCQMPILSDWWGYKLTCPSKATVE